MTETKYKSKKDLPSSQLLAPGTPMCAGCGALSSLHQIYDILGEKTVFVNAAGCMTLLSIYPSTPFRGSWLYTSMASASAGAQGVRDALDIRVQKGRIAPEENLDVVVITGDGSASGMGLSSTSGAIDRRLDYICICYDNEGYGNTGHQYSALTPRGAKSATSRGQIGFSGSKKDLFDIWRAHDPAYIATVNPAEPLDLARKIEKAAGLKGPRMIIAFAPCPSGWSYESENMLEIGKLATKTGIWPLKEYRAGEVVHTKIPSERAPVEEYLKTQKRFDHLFSAGNENVIRRIQKQVDEYWKKVEA